MREEQCILEKFVHFDLDEEVASTTDWEEANQWLQEGKEVYAYIFLNNRNCITSPVKELDMYKKVFVTLTRGKTRTKYVIQRE